MYGFKQFAVKKSELRLELPPTKEEPFLPYKIPIPYSAAHKHQSSST
jgi:hypothetical protein